MWPTTPTTFRVNCTTTPGAITPTRAWSVASGPAWPKSLEEAPKRMKTRVNDQMTCTFQYFRCQILLDLAQKRKTIEYSLPQDKAAGSVTSPLAIRSSGESMRKCRSGTTSEREAYWAMATRCCQVTCSTEKTLLPWLWRIGQQLIRLRRRWKSYSAKMPGYEKKQPPEERLEHNKKRNLSFF